MTHIRIPHNLSIWISAAHQGELSVTPTDTGFRVSLWSSDGHRCFATHIIKPETTDA